MNAADRPSLFRRHRWKFAGLAIVAAVAGGLAWQQHTGRKSNVEFRSALVARGPITASVSASGTLNPVTSVLVGSQVSGQLKEVLADFNAEVRKGQLIARIDPETFEYRVRQSQADVDAARAQVLTAQANVAAARAAVSRAEVNLAEARRDRDRKQMLVERNFISAADLEKARAVHDSAQEDLRSVRAQVEVALAQANSAAANVKQREAQLAQARVDLERTAIRAPVDGVVIKRSVDAGQTVAASLQAPELFIIAQSLRDMQVDTSVDEAEIGKVKPGLRATFTVDAFPGRSFSGEVRQVRKAAQTVQNVVTYTVVVSAQNPDLALVPGMTANVRIVTDTRDAVLRVPNAALRFRPPNFQEPQAEAAQAATAPAQAAAPPPQAAGDQGAQIRERLGRDLALDDTQKQQLEAIFAGMRDKFIAARSAPESERAKLRDRNRAELRDKINEILTQEQRVRYAAIVAEQSGRQSGRGRVFVLDAQGMPAPVQVRTGLNDGSFTEVSAEGLKEGDKVLIGTVAPTGQAATRPASPSGPRLPF
ncbi:MAG: hypothetical protein RIS35_3178 [Pseudomonadota bacterium]